MILATQSVVELMASEMLAYRQRVLPDEDLSGQPQHRSQDSMPISSSSTIRSWNCWSRLSQSGIC